MREGNKRLCNNQERTTKKIRKKRTTEKYKINKKGKQ